MAKEEPAAAQGFATLERGRLKALLREDFREALLALYPEGPIPPPAGRPKARALGGRNRAALLPWPGREAEAKVVLRRYRHGGLLGGLLGERYWAWRGARELALLDEARRAGLPVPQPLAAVAWTGGLFGHREELVTAALPETRPLDEHLASRGREGGPAAAQRRDHLLEQGAKLVRRLHDLGFNHPDLNLANFLVQDGEPQPLFLVDFDRAVRAGGPLPPGERIAALVRLCRSAAKLGPGLIAPEERLRFFLFYTDKSPELAALRERLFARCRRALRWRGRE